MRLGPVVAILLATLLATLAGCAKTYDPFKVPREDIRGQISTIAMAPTWISETVMSREEARATFEAAATERLEGAGFRVIPSEAWQEIWIQSSQDVGGIYDRSTGEVDEERRELVREAVYRALESDYEAQAILYLSIRTEELYNTNGNPGFCGGRRRAYFPLAGSPEPPKSLDVTMARALCLSASLYDMETRQLYGIRNPLEVIETYARQTRAVRPKEERLRDPEQIERTLEAVVGPLADGAGTPSP